MAIVTTHTVSSFRDEMQDEDYSYDALTALYEYFEDLDGDFELDPVAIRCDFTEYVSLEEAWEDYMEEPFPGEEEAEEEFNNWTTILPVKDGRWLVGTF